MHIYIYMHIKIYIYKYIECATRITASPFEFETISSMPSISFEK